MASSWSVCEIISLRATAIGYIRVGLAIIKAPGSRAFIVSRDLPDFIILQQR